MCGKEIFKSFQHSFEVFKSRLSSILDKSTDMPSARNNVNSMSRTLQIPTCNMLLKNCDCILWRIAGFCSPILLRVNLLWLRYTCFDSRSFPNNCMSSSGPPRPWLHQNYLPVSNSPSSSTMISFHPILSVLKYHPTDLFRNISPSSFPALNNSELGEIVDYWGLQLLLTAHTELLTV